VLDRIADRVLVQLEPPNGSPWMNLNTAAEYLDWSPKRLYNLVASNEIPHRKQGNRLLFNRQELDRWLDLHYQGPVDLSP
jgi:excisionase family DNA binding protein